MWNAINEVLKPNLSNNKSAVRSLVSINETNSDYLEIVQKFNEHFSTAAKKLHDSIPITTTRLNFVSNLGDIPSHEIFRFASVSATVI